MPPCSSNEATSLSGKPLMIPAAIPNKQKLDADLAESIASAADQISKLITDDDTDR